MLTPRFVSELIGSWKSDRPECDEAVRTQEHWRVGVVRGALSFAPDFPRVIMACGEEFEIPLERLRPWLNEQGKAAFATLPR